MTNIFASPYFDGEEEPTQPVISQLKEMFPSNKQHMQILLKTYKLCFPKKINAELIFNKNEDTLLKDIKNNDYSFDFVKAVEEQKAALFEHANRDKILATQLENIPVFLDFAFIYYVWYFDDQAPIHKMPSTVLKFNMITDALGVERNDLYSAFFKCVENNFIKELRIEKPPFMLRTEMTFEDVQKKLLDINPLLKNILDALLKLNN